MHAASVSPKVWPPMVGTPTNRNDALNENLQLYDAEICFMDEQFGVLIKGLKDRQRLNDALVVVVADHGENFDPSRASRTVTHSMSAHPRPAFRQTAWPAPRHSGRRGV
jgi:arylsulfatase A-like enzyme